MSSSTHSFQETFRNDEVVIALHKAISTALHTPQLGGARWHWGPKFSPVTT